MKQLICILLLFFASGNSYSQSGWIPQQSGTSYTLRSIYFINSNTGWATGDEGTIIKTTNGGNNWIHQTSNTNIALYGILFSDVNNGVAAGYYNDGNPWCQEIEILLSTSNGGNTWNILRQGYAGRISDFTSAGNNNFYIAYDGRDLQCMMTAGAISKTTNNGVNWTNFIPSNNGSYSYYSVHFINSMIGWAAGQYRDDCCNNVVQIMMTTSGGADWTIQKRDTAGGFHVFPFSKMRFVNQTTGYMFGSFRTFENLSLLKTTDAGTSWNYTDSILTQGKNNLHFANSQTGWCVGDYGSLVFTSDGGNNWQTQNSNTLAYLYGIHFIDQYTGWAAGSGGSIVKTITSGLTAITPSSVLIPDKFYLHQNYPNPFNPVTHLEFGISDLPARPGGGFVTLKVYDALGKEVSTLVNEIKSPGNYSVEFDGSYLSSGIYFYRLHIEGNAWQFGFTRSMVLMK